MCFICKLLNLNYRQSNFSFLDFFSLVCRNKPRKCEPGTLWVLVSTLTPRPPGNLSCRWDVPNISLLARNICLNTHYLQNISGQLLVCSEIFNVFLCMCFIFYILCYLFAACIGTVECLYTNLLNSAKGQYSCIGWWCSFWLFFVSIYSLQP